MKLRWLTRWYCDLHFDGTTDLHKEKVLQYQDGNDCWVDVPHLADYQSKKRAKEAIKDWKNKHAKKKQVKS